MRKQIGSFLIVLFFLPIINLSTETLSKEKLKEELLYWKGLLDDDLITLEDYEIQKNLLINQINNKNTTVSKKDTNNKSEKTNKNTNIDKTFIVELSDSQIKQSQSYLRTLGYYKQFPSDGIVGPNTISAMKNWLKDNYSTSINIFNYDHFEKLEIIYYQNMFNDKNTSVDKNTNSLVENNVLEKKAYCLSENGGVSVATIINEQVMCGAGVEISKEEYLNRIQNKNKNYNNFVKKDSKKKKLETAEEKALRIKRSQFLMKLGNSLMNGQGVAGAFNDFNSSSNTNNNSGTTCFKESEAQEGFNKICFYSCVGTPYAINLDSPTALCPLTIKR